MKSIKVTYLGRIYIDVACFRIMMRLFLRLNLSVFFVAVTWICYAQCHMTPSNNISCDGSVNTLFDLIGVAESALYSAKRIKIRVMPDQNFQLTPPMDCADVLARYPSSKSKIYQVSVHSRVSKGPINVYCDMDDDGGAWTVIQRRGNFDSPKDYFYRDWISYKNGFGDLLKDFWIGNDAIYSLTNQRLNTVKFILSDWEGNTTYATYDEFWIDDEDHNYTMHAKGYRGTAGDGFSYSSGLAFSTKDKDHDTYPESCAVQFKGAWWYGACHHSNLNGQYLKGAHESYADGVNWVTFRGQHYSLMESVIKIRPRDFVKKLELNVTPH